MASKYQIWQIHQVFVKEPTSRHANGTQRVRCGTEIRFFLPRETSPQPAPEGTAFYKLQKDLSLYCAQQHQNIVPIAAEKLQAAAAHAMVAVLSKIYELGRACAPSSPQPFAEKTYGYCMMPQLQ